MAKLSIKAGSESVSLILFVQDSTSTTGGGKTGLAYNTASLTCYYVRPGSAAASVSLVTQTVTGAWASGGFVEIDSTNMPGFYRFDIPNAALAAGVRSVGVLFKGATGMAPLPLEIDLGAEVDAVKAGGTVWASGAITAASIATDAIDADALAADASTEINTAVLAAIAGIGTAGGAAINVDTATDNVLGGITGVTSGTTFAGTQSSGTYANTSNVNAVYHVITGTASGNTAMDIVYQFLTGAGTNVVQATWVGYVTSANDTITVSAWRHDTGAWESLTTIVGTATSATIQTKNITLFARHRGTSTAELGKVYLRLHCTGMTTPVVGTDQIVVSYAVSSRGTYSDGAVWINTGASNTNTQAYVDGLPENPVSTIAAAITIATNLNLRRYRVANGSSITLAADHVNRTMLGHGYTLAFGSQNVSGSYFEGVEGLSGTATCPTAECIVVDCHLNAVTIGEADFIRCHLMNTVTLAQNSVPYRFHDCSGIANAVIEFGGSSQSCVISAVSGVLTITGMAAGDTLYVDGNCDLTLGATCTGGTVYISGNIRLTNNGSGQTIYDSARWDENQNVASVTGNVGGSVASVTGAVGSVTGAVGSVTGNVGGNVVGSVASVTGNVGGSVASVVAGVTLADDAITAAKIAAGAITSSEAPALANLDAAVSSRLAAASYSSPLDAAGVRTAVGLATANLDTQLAGLPTDADVQAAATAALNAYDPPTKAEMDARTLTAASYATAAALDAVDNYVDTEVAAIKAVTDKLDTAVELDGAVYRFTTNALELAPAGGGGGTDWTSDERTAIRSILGIPASGTTPESPTTGILDTIRDGITGLNDLSQAEAQAATAAALAAYDPPTKAELDSAVSPLAVQTSVDDLEGRLTSTRAGYLDNLSGGAVATAASIAALNNLSQAQAQTAAAAALAAYDPPTKAEMDARTLPAADYATASSLAVVDSIADRFNTMVQADGDVYQFTVNALENTPSEIGDGSVTVIYPVRGPGGVAVANARVRVTLHDDPTAFRAQAYSDTFGNATFHLDPGEYDFYSYHNDYVFANPDTEVVAAP